MKEQRYLPEGMMETRCPRTADGLDKARESGEILEATAVRCGPTHDLIVDLGEMTGIIPRQEAVLGIETGQVKDIAILSRVGRPVCFQVLSVDQEAGTATLSRRRAQEECLHHLMDTLSPGDILPAVVTHLEPFGAFIDIGLGIPSLISIENISVSRISHPADRFVPGQHIYVVVRSVDTAAQRIYVSHKELLGTWQENASRFSVGETVTGIVRSVEDYGVFVELTPNLAGLCEYRNDVTPGQRVSVFIKNIIPQRMKVKMLIIGALEPAPRLPLHYALTEGHLHEWVYSPAECPRTVRTQFETPTLCV